MEDDYELNEQMDSMFLGDSTQRLEEEEEEDDDEEEDLLDPLVKAESLRVQERQTFISAVSRNLGIGINDLASVSALNTVTADYNRQQRGEARDAAKALELEKVEDDLGPMFAEAEGDYVHETVVACDTLGSPRGRGATSGPGFTGEGFGTRKWRAAELGKQGLPPYKLAPSLTRMEDFRLQGGERSGFGVPAYFSDKSKELVDPYDIQRDDLSGWRVPSPYHAGGAVHFHATFPKPKRVKGFSTNLLTTDSPSAAAAYEGASHKILAIGADGAAVALTSTAAAASSPHQQHSSSSSSAAEAGVAVVDAGPERERQQQLAVMKGNSSNDNSNSVGFGSGYYGSSTDSSSSSSCGSGGRGCGGSGCSGSTGSSYASRQMEKRSRSKDPGPPVGSIVGAHQNSLPWYPGNDQEHRFSVEWHRDHSVSESYAGDGRAVTASKLLIGANLKAKKADKAAESKRRHLAEKEARSLRKQRLKDLGERSIEEADRLDAISAEIARIGAMRNIASEKKDRFTAQRKEAASKANRRVSAFRAAGGKLEALKSARLGAHPLGAFPLPMGTPFEVRAKDLFKTFRDDECL